MVELGPERCLSQGIRWSRCWKQCWFPRVSHPRAAHSVVCTQLLEAEPGPRGEASDSCLRGTSRGTLCSSRARNWRVSRSPWLLNAGRLEFLMYLQTLGSVGVASAVQRTATGRRPDVSAPVPAQVAPWQRQPGCAAAGCHPGQCLKNIKTLKTWSLKGKSLVIKYYVLKIPNFETNGQLLMEMFVSF